MHTWMNDTSEAMHPHCFLSAFETFEQSLCPRRNQEHDCLNEDYLSNSWRFHRGWLIGSYRNVQKYSWKTTDSRCFASAVQIFERVTIFGGLFIQYKTKITITNYGFCWRYHRVWLTNDAYRENNKPMHSHFFSMVVEILRIFCNCMIFRWLLSTIPRPHHHPWRDDNELTTWRALSSCIQNRLSSHRQFRIFKWFRNCIKFWGWPPSIKSRFHSCLLFFFFVFVKENLPSKNFFFRAIYNCIHFLYACYW